MSVFKKGETWKVVDCEAMGITEGLFEVSNGYTWVVQEDSNYQRIGSANYDIHGDFVEDGYVERVSEAYKELTKSTPQKPSHYQVLPEYRVKDINKALLDKIQESDFEMSLNEAGWYQQSMQYFMRFYAKNGLEDLKKGVETMQIVIDSLESGKETL